MSPVDYSLKLCKGKQIASAQGCEITCNHNLLKEKNAENVLYLPNFLPSNQLFVCGFWWFCFLFNITCCATTQKINQFMNKSTCKCCNSNKKCKGISTSRCPFYFGKHGDAESWSNYRIRCCWKSLLKARKKNYQEIQPNFQQTPEIPTVLALIQIHMRMTPREISLGGGCSKRNLSAVNHLHSTETPILTLNYGTSFGRQKEMNYWFHANYFISLRANMPLVSWSFKLLLYKHTSTA